MNGKVISGTQQIFVWQAPQEDLSYTINFLVFIWVQSDGETLRTIVGDGSASCFGHMVVVNVFVRRATPFVFLKRILLFSVHYGNSISTIYAQTQSKIINIHVSC